MCRGTDFPRSLNRGKAYLKRNSGFSAKTLLITSKKHTLWSKQTFQRHFENRNGYQLRLPQRLQWPSISIFRCIGFLLGLPVCCARIVSLYTSVLCSISEFPNGTCARYGIWQAFNESYFCFTNMDSLDIMEDISILLACVLLIGLNIWGEH